MRLGQTDRQTGVPCEVVVWSVQFGLLGLSQGATTVPELRSPSEQGLNAGQRVWQCEPGSTRGDDGKESVTVPGRNQTLFRFLHRTVTYAIGH